MDYLLEVLNVMNVFMSVGREGMRKGLEIKSLTGGLSVLVSLEWSVGMDKTEDRIKTLYPVPLNKYNS